MSIALAYSDHHRANQVEYIRWRTIEVLRGQNEPTADGYPESVGQFLTLHFPAKRLSMQLRTFSCSLCPTTAA